MKKHYVCCFCGQTFNDYGNNPSPIAINPEERCCNECNSEIVIPARMFCMMNGIRFYENPEQAHAFIYEQARLYGEDEATA